MLICSFVLFNVCLTLQTGKGLIGEEGIFVFKE